MYGAMKNDDARKLDHATLEALRIRAVRSVQSGESPEVVAWTLMVTPRTMYRWLAEYRRGGWDGLNQEARGPPSEARRQKAAMDLRDCDAKEPAAAEIRVRLVDARDGGGVDQEKVWCNSRGQFSGRLLAQCRYG
jgi:transposase